MSFRLISTFQPQGDQPQAIEQLATGLENGECSRSTLLPFSFLSAKARSQGCCKQHHDDKPGNKI